MLDLRDDPWLRGALSAEKDAYGGPVTRAAVDSIGPSNQQDYRMAQEAQATAAARNRVRPNEEPAKRGSTVVFKGSTSENSE